jgi:hypothetical protein
VRRILNRLKRSNAVMLLAASAFVTAGVQVANAQACSGTAIFWYGEGTYLSCSAMMPVLGKCYWECVIRTTIPDTTLQNSSGE